MEGVCPACCRCCCCCYYCCRSRPGRRRTTSHDATLAPPHLTTTTTALSPHVPDAPRPDVHLDPSEAQAQRPRPLEARTDPFHARHRRRLRALAALPAPLRLPPRSRPCSPRLLLPGWPWHTPAPSWRDLSSDFLQRCIVLAQTCPARSATRALTASRPSSSSSAAGRPPSSPPTRLFSGTRAGQRPSSSSNSGPSRLPFS
jgi:hypothetical protein